MEVLNVEPILSTFVAGAQNVGLFGMVAIVALTALEEVISR